MAVITRAAESFGRAGQGQRVIRPYKEPDKITKAQQAQIDLRREEMKAQEKANRKSMNLRLFLAGLGIVERGVTKAVLASQDPAAIRTADAWADRSAAAQKGLEAEFGAMPTGEPAPEAAPTEGFSASDVPRGAPPRKSLPPVGEAGGALRGLGELGFDASVPPPAPPLPSPPPSGFGGRQAPPDAPSQPPTPAPGPLTAAAGAPEGPPIVMTEGDVAQMKQLPAELRAMKDNPAALNKFLIELEKKGIPKAEGRVGFEQVADVLGNMDRYIAEGRLKVEPGPPSGVFEQLELSGMTRAAEKRPDEPWLQGHRAAAAFGTAEEARGFFGTFQKMRETLPEAEVADVLSTALDIPAVLGKVLEEAKAAAIFDTTEAQDAYANGDFARTKQLLLPAMMSQPGEYPGIPEGLEKARRRSSAYPTVPFSINEVRDQYTPIYAADDPKDAERLERLLDPRLLIRASGKEQIPGWRQAIAGEDGPEKNARIISLLRAHVTSGEAKFVGGGPERAHRLYTIAAEGEKEQRAERKVDIQELKASKLRDRGSYSKDSASVLTTENIEDVRAWPEYALVAKHKGRTQAEQGAKWASSKRYSVSKRNWLRGEAEKIEAKAGSAVTARQKAEDRVTQKEVARDKKSASLAALHDKHGTTPDRKMTPKEWVALQVSKVKGRAKKSAEDQAKPRAVAGAKSVNDAIAKALKAEERAGKALTRAEKDYEDFLKRHGLE